MGFGAILSGIGVGASAIGSVASSALGFVGSIASTAVNAIGHVAQVGLGVLKVAGGVLAGAVGAFVGAVGLASKATLDFSNNILSIKASTGMGFGAASKTAMNFGAFGVSSGDLAGMLDNIQMIPQLFKPRAQAFGLPDYQSKDFIPKLAAEFQKLGPIVGRSMLQTLGMDTPSIRRLAAISPEKLQAQQGFSQRIQTSLGVSPGAVQGWAEDFSLLMNRVGQFTDLLKYKFASEMLPFLTTALEKVTDYLGRNSGKISDLIKSGISWVFNDLPGLIIDTISIIGHTASSFLRTLGDTGKGLGSWVVQFLSTIDQFGNSLVGIINTLGKVATIVGAVSSFILNTFNSIMGFFAKLPTAAKVALSVVAPPLAPIIMGASIMAAKGYDFNKRSEAMKFSPITTNFHTAETYKNYMDNSGTNTLNNTADAIDKNTDKVTSTISDLIGATNKKMDEQGKDLKGIRQATEKTANGGNGSPMSATIERFEGYIAEDAWALANR